MIINKTIFSSSLFKASGIYTFTSILNAAIPFFLLPILTRYLTPEDYGVVSMFALLVSIFGVFTGLSVHGAINRVYFEKKIDFKVYVFNALVILSVSSILTLILAVIFLKYIAHYSSVPEIWITLAVVVSFFQFLILSVLSIYQARMMAQKYSLIQFSSALLNGLLSIILVVAIGLKWEGRILGQVIATTVIGLLCLILLKNWIDLKFNFSYIKHALKFGVPLIPHALGGMFIIATDRLLITNLINVKETGIYTVGLQIGSIVTLFADAFNKAYAPWLFEKLNQNNEITKIKIVKFTYLYFLVILCFAMALGLSAPFLTKYLLGKSFSDSSAVVLWIALGGAFNGMYYMTVNYIFYVYKTHFLSALTFISGVLNIVFTYYFIKYFGILGAGYSYALIFLFQFLITWFLSSKSYKMPWFNFKIVFTPLRG